MKNKVNEKMIELYISGIAAKRACIAKLKDNSGTGSSEQGFMIAAVAALVGIGLLIMSGIFKEEMTDGVKNAIDTFFTFT